MKRKFILTLSIASLLCLGSVASLSSCEPIGTGGGQNLEDSTLYKVTVESGEGFKVIGINETGYKAGETVNFKVEVSDSTKEVDKVKANDVLLSKTADGGYSFKMGSEDAKITVTLKEKGEEFTLASVTVSDNIANGTVTLSKLGKVKVGDTIEIIAIANEGFKVDKYYLNDKELTGNSFVVVEGENVINVTFVALPPETIYGSVRVLTDEVINGNVEATLEDGTKISEDNRRQPVGTKIILNVNPKDECYGIESLKLNDQELVAGEDGKFSFEVIEGKNFISAEFSLINPGKGLVRLADEVEHAEVNIDKIDQYYNVGETVTITINPDENYSVKEVSVNGEKLTKNEDTNTFTFEIKEGLNTISIFVASTATGIEFVPDENWLVATDLSQDAYYVIEGNSYQLETSFTPEGSFDELIFEVGAGNENYIEVDETGKLTVKKAYNSSNITVKVSLKSNPSISDTLYLRAVKQSQHGIEILKNELLEAKDKEIKEANKTQLVVEEKSSSEEKASKTTYDFEVFNDMHSVTTVTDELGDTTRYYRTIKDNVFYSLMRDGDGTRLPQTTNSGPSAVTSENQDEYQNMVTSMGAIEFGYTASYNGVIDYLYQNLFGDYSIYKYDYSVIDQYDIFECTTVVTSLTEFDVYTKVAAVNSWDEPYIFEIHMNFSFDYYGYLESATYERKDYEGVTSVDQSVDGLSYDLEKFTINLTYEEKGEDENNYFDIEDYFYQDFTPEVYSENDLIDENKVSLDEDGTYHINPESTFYINLSNATPSTALNDIDEVEVTSSNDEIIASNRISMNSSGLIYFSPERNKSGEVTLTIKSKYVTKEVKFTVEFLDVTEVNFDATIDSVLLSSSEVMLEATVTPDAGVSSTDVKYEIVEDTTGGATIDEREDRWGISTDFYLIAGPSAGSVIVRVTSVANPEVYDEMTFEVKEVPNILDSVVGKTYEASWSTYYPESSDYYYSITFGDDASDLTATINFSKTTESYYGDTTVEEGTFEAKVSQNQSTLTLSELTAVGEATADSSLIDTTLLITLDDEFNFTGLTVTGDGEEEALTEYVDLSSYLIGNTFDITWEDYSGDYSMKMTISGTNANDMKASIELTSSSYYYGDSTGTFTADVKVRAGKIALENITKVSGDIYDTPPSELDFEIDEEGKLTISYGDSGYSDWY